MMETTNESSEADLWHLYQQMLCCRWFEMEVKRLWEQGAIQGEMHMSMGEEAIVVAVVDQLVEGDAMALDHRGTAPMLVRGIDPVLLLKEFMGRTDGLCNGMGGHMHLFSKEHMAASSGIVGASGPAAVGFALANKRLRSGRIAVAFFGEGAINEGMMMEAITLAVVWKLPVMFVCKEDGRAIFTSSVNVTAGNINDRVRGFGCRVVDFKDLEVEELWQEVHEEIMRLRNGDGPVFLHAYCPHLEGHLLGDPYLRFTTPSTREVMLMGGMVKAFLGAKQASWRERMNRVGTQMRMLVEAGRKYRSKEGDPIPGVRQRLTSVDGDRLREIEAEIQAEVATIVEKAMLPVEGEGGQL